MAAVSNSSPLILYARSGLLYILHEVFGEVWIPPAVYREVVIDGAGRPGADEVRAAPWIIESAAPAPPPSPVPGALGAGEVDAIALAWQVRPSTPIVLDDAGGRRYASRLGLRVYGSAGVLIEAKRLGLLAEVGGPLRRLISAGLRLSTTVHVDVLLAADEAER